MMFYAKLFAVISAVLAVAVSGSPTEFAEGLYILTIPFIQAADGTVNYCDNTGCKDLSISPNTCVPLPNDVNKEILSFNVKTGFSACTVYPYVNSSTASERQVI